MHDGGLVLRVVDGVHQRREVRGVLVVQRAVRTQVAEGAVGQVQRLLDGVGRQQRQRDAGAFQHMHHAEEAQRAAARDGVVGVGHHHLGGVAGAPVAHGFGVTAAGDDVVEDPLVVAGFLFDVLVHRRGQPRVVRRQRGAQRLQQRHGVAHVVVGLGEEGDVARQRNLAAQRTLDDGRGQHSTASKTIREDLRHDFKRLGQGRNDDLKTITKEVQSKFLEANLPESDLEFFRRMVIVEI